MDFHELRKQAAGLLFTPQEPVRWLAPKELTRTAVKVGLAAVFADYADKREMQGALQAALLHAPPARPDADEIWITSTTKELAPIVRLDGAAVGPGRPGPVWRRVRDAFDRLVGLPA